MTRWFRETVDALGHRATIAALIALVAGVVGFATGLGPRECPGTFGALIASWIFFTGIAAGALAFRALFRIIEARWAEPMAILSGAMVGFAPVALGLLLVIVIAADLAPWLHADPDSTWMGVPAVAIRQLLATAALFACGSLLQPRSQGDDRRGAVIASVYCIAYAIALSLWGVDLVLGADAVFESTLIGPFVFMSAFLAGTALVTLLALRLGSLSETARRDAAKLVLALSIFWAYLFWSQYLTIWYGNLPEEVGFALRRTEGGWGSIVLAAIGLVFTLPFAVLLHPAGRSSARALTALLVLQILGLWLICQLLIVPSLTPPEASAFDPRTALIALGILGAFSLAIARRVKRAATNLERKIS